MGNDKLIRIECHNIIDEHCKECPNNVLDISNCTGCLVFRTLGYLGKQLIHEEERIGTPKRKFFLTVEEYVELKKTKTNKDIANLIGVNLSLLGVYIKRWRNEGKLGK